MPTGCAVFGCKSLIPNVEKSVLFHRFPKDEETRKFWVRFCKRPEKFNAVHARMCSKHFETSAYERDLRNELLGLPVRKRLLPTGIPTIFDDSATSTHSKGTKRKERVEQRERQKLVEELLRDHGEDNPPTTTTVTVDDIRSKYKPKPSKAAADPAKRKKSFRYCLLCFKCFCLDHKSTQHKAISTDPETPTENGNLSTPSLPSRTRSDFEGVLGENLEVIFVLRNIFNFDSTDLLKFMKVSKGRNPQRWYHLCSECDGIIKQAVAIQYQIHQLSRELENCKSRIQVKVKESLEGPSEEIKEGKPFHLQVEKVIRESICTQVKATTSVETDVDQDQVEVKSEPVDAESVDLDNEDPFTNEDFEGTEKTEATIINHDTVGKSPLSSILTPTASGDLIDKEGLRKLKLRKYNQIRKGTEVICETCGDTVRRFQLPLHNLRVHGILMSGCKEFKCLVEGCSYTSVYNHHLRMHTERTHSPDQLQEHVCKYCGKVFKRGAHLRRHESLHENAHSRPYQCELCGSCFPVSSYLRHHYNTVHLGRKYHKTWLLKKGRKGRKQKTTVPDTDALSISTKLIAE